MFSALIISSEIKLLYCHLIRNYFMQIHCSHFPVLLKIRKTQKISSCIIFTSVNCYPPHFFPSTVELRYQSKKNKNLKKRLYTGSRCCCLIKKKLKSVFKQKYFFKANSVCLLVVFIKTFTKNFHNLSLQGKILYLLYLQ